MPRLLTHVQDIRELPEEYRQFYDYNAAEARYELQIEVAAPVIKKNRS